MGQLSSSPYQQRYEVSWLPCLTHKHMTNTFLLVGSSLGSSWAANVRDGLRPLGEVETVSAAEAREQSLKTNYRMIIIDAGAVAEVSSLITQLRGAAPSVPIVVATASPTWQSAKEVFLTGASDYIRKSLDATALRATLQEILSKSR